jgi:hypothetical protein
MEQAIITRNHKAIAHHRPNAMPSNFFIITILRTKLARDRAVRAKFVEIRVRFNQGKV